METYIGTCWRMNIAPWFREMDCDAFLLMLEEPDFSYGAVRCLILGIDSDAWETRPGHIVNVRIKELRPMF
jgi:hypothetical protein